MQCLGGSRRKAFFFEKKKQKTFVRLLVGDGLLVPFAEKEQPWLTMPCRSTSSF